jgi:hypothetical protein
MPKKKKRGSGMKEATAHKLLQNVNLSEEDKLFFEGFCIQYGGKPNNFLEAALKQKLKLFHKHIAEEEAASHSSMDEEGVNEAADDDQLLEEDIDPSNYDIHNPPQAPLAIVSLEETNSGYESDDSELQEAIECDGETKVDAEEEENFNSFMQEQLQLQQQREVNEQQQQQQQQQQHPVPFHDPMSIGNEVPNDTLTIE